VEEVMRCWSGCFAGGAVAEAGGGVVAHGRRLQTVMLLLQAVEKKLLFFPSPPFSFSPSAAFPFPFGLLCIFTGFFFLVCFPFPLILTVPLPFVSSPVLSFLVRFYPSQFGFTGGSFCFRFFFLYSLPLFFFFFLPSVTLLSFRSLSLLSAVRFFLSFPLLFLCLSSSFFFRVLALGVFIGQKRAGASLLPPYGSAWGAGLCCPTTAPSWLANGRSWQGAAPLVFSS
jgi:hypothetical protein